MALIRDDTEGVIHCNVLQRPDEAIVRTAQTQDSRMSQQSTRWSATTALHAMSRASERLERAIQNGTAVSVLFRGAPYLTAESAEAAEYILPRKNSLRRKLYTVVPYR